MSWFSRRNVKSQKRWRLLTVTIIIAVLVAGIYVLMAPIRESKQLEQSLIDRFGWANRYTPPIDGSVPPARLEGFIRIRKALQPNCKDFQGVLDDVLALEAIEADEEMAAGEKASRSISGFKNMIGAAPKFLQFMDTRNSALLSEEMGLGEYIYLYLAAYAEQLADEPNSAYSDMKEAYVTQRTRDEYIRILGNQLDALEATGPETSVESLMNDLRAEITALKDGSRSSPWPNGLPNRTRESLAPYKERLAGLYCTGIVKIELLQKNRGFKFEG
jgi:hypothetical protein